MFILFITYLSFPLRDVPLVLFPPLLPPELGAEDGAGVYDGELFLEEPEGALPRVEPPPLPELPEPGEPEYPRPRLAPLPRGAL
jgi:hypothetical protein